MLACQRRSSQAVKAAREATTNRRRILGLAGAVMIDLGQWVWWHISWAWKLQGAIHGSTLLRSMRTMSIPGSSKHRNINQRSNVSNSTAALRNQNAVRYL